MKWYYAEGGKQIGPVEESALDDLVRQGVVRDDTLVWREGMAAWQRHAAVRGGSNPGPAATAAPPPPPVRRSGPSGDTRYCSECGRAVPASQLTSYGDVSVCAQCQPAYSQRLRGAARAILAVSGCDSWRSLSMGSSSGWSAPSFAFRLDLAMGGVGLGLGRNPDPAQVMAALPAIMGMVGLSFLIQMALSLAYEVYFLTTQGRDPREDGAGSQSDPRGRGPDIGRAGRRAGFSPSISAS